MVFALPALLLSLGSLIATQPVAVCSSWQECQQLALEAAEREYFETFHEFAWKAVQKGRPNDPDLMFLLARAQSLSGRPDDARVMLERLAERGILHPEVETLPDFSRVRLLAVWPNLLERMRGTPPPAVVAVSPPAKPATAPAAPVVSPPVIERDAASPTIVPITSVLPIPPTVIAPVAMAYDKVSARMIIADNSSGTIKVLSEMSGSTVDLVSAGWGGGYHTTALAIDSKRGDLWVAGTRTGEAPESVVHRVQLISGRLLYTVPRPEDSGATRFTAVALSAASVFVLDAEGGRIFELSGTAKTLRLRTTLTQRDLTGLAVASDSVAYVAHAGGILRIDLGTKRSTSVKAAPGIALDGIEWIGHFENSLLAVQRRPDGTMTAVRLRFDRRGVTVTAVDSFGAAAATGAAVLGDTFYFVSALPGVKAVARVNLR